MCHRSSPLGSRGLEKHSCSPVVFSQQSAFTVPHGALVNQPGLHLLFHHTVCSADRFPKTHERGGAGFTPGELPAKPLLHTHTQRYAKRKRKNRRTPVSWPTVGGSNLGLDSCYRMKWKTRFLETHGEGTAPRIGLHAERWSCSNIHTLGKAPASVAFQNLTVHSKGTNYWNSLAT